MVDRLLEVKDLVFKGLDEDAFLIWLRRVLNG